MHKKRLEVISLVERRRKWPAEAKARIMEDALVPGATVTGVADRHGVHPSQVYAWLRLARTGRLPGVSVAAPSQTAFVPVRIAEAAVPPAPAKPVAASPARRRTSMIEIALGNGRSIKADEGIDPAVLARIADALDRSAS